MTKEVPLPPIDRQQFVAGLGGAASVAMMSTEEKADALEAHLHDRLAPRKFPTVAEVAAEVNTRTYRRGVGSLFVAPKGNVDTLPPLPDKPTLTDFMRLRFGGAIDHCLQSAHLAKKNGVEEDIIFASLLHDLPMAMMRSNHGFWSAQLFEPYVSEKVTFAIRHHATLRFFPDKDAGYEYPDLYKTFFGEDFVPPPHVQAEYEMVRKHPWYALVRTLTVNDLYAFDPTAKVDLGAFEDIIGRNFRQPKEGLGFDGSPVAHMWRTIGNPDSPL